MDSRIRELIHGELDGINSPEQSKELQGILAADSKAADYFRELKDLDATLKGSPMVEPPASLKADIMAEIGAGQSHTTITPIHVGSASRNRVSLKAVSMFAVGLAAGLACFLLFGGGDRPAFLNQSDLYGTIAAVKDRSVFTPVAEQELTLDGVTAEIKTHSAKGIGSATLEIETEGTVDVALSFEPNRMSFLGFGQSTGTANQFSIEDGTIHFVNSGNGRYTFLFAGSELPAGEITVAILRDGLSRIESVPLEIGK